MNENEQKEEKIFESRTNEKLNMEQKEKIEKENLFKWIKELTKESTNYIKITGSYENCKVKIFYETEDQKKEYKHNYIDGKDFLYILKEVLDTFNDLDRYVAVSIIPQGSRGTIEIHLFYLKD